MSTRQSDQSSQEFFPPPPAVGVGLASEVETTYPSSRVIDVADGQVIYTPGRPDFRDGNQTLLNRPPEPDDRWEWRTQTVFEEHAVDFVQLVWEEPLGASNRSLGPPFQTRQNVVLTRTIAENDSNGESEVLVDDVDSSFRELTSESDFEAFAQQRADVDEDQGLCAGLSRWFSTEAVSQIRLGQARWFGVRDGQRLVSTAGLVVTSAGLRFQDVMTHPNKRREGWATKLLHSMIAESSANADEQLVIVAEDGSAAEGIYRRLGFAPVSRLVTATARRNEN